MFAFKKVIQTCLPAQTTLATPHEAAFFKLVAHLGPIADSSSALPCSDVESSCQSALVLISFRLRPDSPRPIHEALEEPADQLLRLLVSQITSASKRSALAIITSGWLIGNMLR